MKTEGGSIYAAALSPDRRWLVFGLQNNNVRVCDAQAYQNIRNIHAYNGSIWSVDISPDSTKFATGGGEKSVFIWSMTTGEQLLGPLQHDTSVVAVRFSPNGDRIATAAGSIRIYNSDNGQQLLDIPCSFYATLASPLAWSADGRRLFAASNLEVKHFDTSSGSLLSKWSVPGSAGPTSILLSRNQRFAAVVARDSLSFWDTTTHQQIGTVINHASLVWSIAFSPNDDIATGESNGKVTLRTLRDILPRSYLTPYVSNPTR
ncbi:WD40 repeat-like protein [Imleria badia]|nr:WD40 repeat-like protein [Imleria badia]